MVRKCKNPWCEGTGWVHWAAVVFCPSCWKHLAGIFAVVIVLSVLEEWDARAPWVLGAVVLVGLGARFAVDWRRLGFGNAWRRLNNGKAGPSELRDQ